MYVSIKYYATFPNGIYTLLLKQVLLTTLHNYKSFDDRFSETNFEFLEVGELETEELEVGVYSCL